MSPITHLLSDIEPQKSSVTTSFTIVENLGKSILGRFLPRRCVGCGQKADWFCAQCLSEIKLVESFVCPVCGNRTLEGFTHRACRSGESLDRLISLYQFRPPIKQAVHRLKYRKEYRIAEVLAELAVADLADLGLDLGTEALIVPVPMYLGRKWPRWFNQAELLAREFGKRLGLKVRTGLLKRIFETRSQTKLNRPERKKNVEGVFWVPWWHRRSVSGRDILLVDDVCTTGATLNSCAQTLKNAGARFVWGLTVAQD
jgi:ComF family protein